MRRTGLLVLAAAAGALLPAAGAGAYGETVDGYPSMDERQIHLFTDMLRVDPMQFWDGEEEYQPLRPLIYNADLNEAGYAHAHDMRINGCFSHESCDGTTFEERVSSYYTNYTAIGENIAAGYGTPETVVFDGWLYSDGHRANMLHVAWNELGTGYDAGGSGGPWYVQDFGKRGEVEEPILTSGAHWPNLPAVGMPAAFHVAYYHPDGDVPDRIYAAVGDSCFEMDLDVGEASMGIYTWELPEVLEAACIPYAFVAELPSGDDVVLPTTGALVMRAGAEECPDFRDQAPASPCTGGGEGGAGGCEAQACDTGTDPSVIEENDAGNTEMAGCDQGRTALRAWPLPSGLIFAGVLLLCRRLVWSCRH